jgi:3-hydroxyisobutyrate dehydrogenase
MAMRVGFLGAGQMGRGMITNLVNAGHVVTVYNRSDEPFAALTGLNITRGATPAEAVDGADVIMSMVTDDKASEGVWEGTDGALSGNPAAGALAIESSTVSIKRVTALARAADLRGLAFLDCPVAGRPDASMTGMLTVFAGGPLDCVQHAAPVLEAISKRVLHFGAVGSGIGFKLIYNAVGATQLASLAEAMAACRDAGLNMTAVTTGLSEGATGSGHVKLHGPLMASGDYPATPPFTPAGRIKDLDYAIALMRDSGIEPVVALAAREVFDAVHQTDKTTINDSQVVDYVPRSQHGR